MDSLQVHRKTREYALNIRAEYFVISNLTHTYLFKNHMGPLRELQIKLWDSHSPMNIKLVLNEILNISLHQTAISSRKEIFLERYNRILKRIIKEFDNIIHIELGLTSMERITNEDLLNVENDILTYMGLENDTSSIPKREQSLQNLAMQAGYLILNKCFCYSVIKAQFHKQFSIEIPELFKNGTLNSLQEQMSHAFGYLVKNFDFAPIFNTDNFFAKLPFSSDLDTNLLEFLEELSEFDLENLEDDFIAEMYQALIPFEKKKELGQIYTPSEVAKKMVQLAVHDPNDIILDPACGCGTFLKEVYSHLAQLQQDQNAISQSLLHEKLLEQVWGVEINMFPAHLSMMTLTFMNLSSFSDLVGVLIHDFLEHGSNGEI